MSREQGIALAMTPENIELSRKGLKTVMRQRFKFPKSVWDDDSEYAWEFDGRMPEGEFAFIMSHYKYSRCPDSCYIKPRYRAGDLCYLPEPWRVNCVIRGKFEIDYFPTPDQARGDTKWFPMKSDTRHSSVIKYYRKNTNNRFNPARHMFRDFARRWARITKVLDPHRIQDITYDDAIAEGFGDRNRWTVFPSQWEYADAIGMTSEVRKNPQAGFATEWNSIHGPRAWELNKWVVPYEYEMVKK